MIRNLTAITKSIADSAATDKLGKRLIELHIIVEKKSMKIR